MPQELSLVQSAGTVGGVDCATAPLAAVVVSADVVVCSRAAGAVDTSTLGVISSVVVIFLVSVDEVLSSDVDTSVDVNVSLGTLVIVVLDVYVCTVVGLVAVLVSSDGIVSFRERVVSCVTVLIAVLMIVGIVSTDVDISAGCCATVDAVIPLDAAVATGVTASSVTMMSSSRAVNAVSADVVVPKEVLEEVLEEVLVSIRGEVDIVVSTDGDVTRLTIEPNVLYLICGVVVAFCSNTWDVFLG